MNRPDKPGELSIDEILASIRQNISEEPDAPQSALEAVPEAPPPGAPSHAAPPPPPDAPPSLQDRLSGAFKTIPSAGAASGTGTNGAKRPLPFDQDLADILDEPDGAVGARAAPKPEIRATPELGALGATPPSGPDRPAEQPAAAAKAPSSPPSDPALSAPPAPFGRAFGESATAQPAPRPQTFGFPPLTKRTGFYPPERSEPLLPPVRTDDLVKAASPGPSLTANEAPAAPSFSGADPVSPADPATRFPDFGSVVPSDVVGRGQPTPDSAFGAPPRGAGASLAHDGGPASAHGGTNGFSLRLPQLDTPKPAPAAEPVSPTLPPAAAAVPNPVVPEPVTTKASFSAAPDAVPLAARASDTAPLRKPLGESASLASSSGTLGQDAATDALGALAQGLAASTAKSDAPVPAAVAATVPAASAAPSPSAPDTGAAPSRSLEDVVADMLRPMLQKWVAENMPRIMEKALRSEMQRTLGPGGGSKTPGA